MCGSFAKRTREYWSVQENRPYVFFPNRLKTGTNAREDSIPMLPACGTIFAPQVKNSTRQIVSPPTEAPTAPTLLTFLLNIPQMKGPKKTEAIAPHEIARIVTITAGLKEARIMESKIKNTLPALIRIVKVLSEASFLINPWYRSFVIAELEIRTNAARVDIEADRMRSRITTERAAGITVTRSSGINMSKTGLPFTNASGLLSGERNILVNAPVK